MSGIAALHHYNGACVDNELIRDMASLMTQRGPIKQQYWHNGSTALAHCLLATTPEAINEQQPSNLDNSYWITADARIDARSELVNKIRRHKAHISNSTTDDQLILCAYQIWGVDCLQHIIGDFAFVIWDTNKQRLFCATDHFGVSPLYYSPTPSGICVSNTLNAIRLHPHVSDELDELSIADYLLFRTNENNESTSFKNIKHLPASHYLLVEKQSIKLQQYWELSPRQEFHHTKPETYIEEFRELLQTAVHDRSRGDVVGTHLSGGMDSTSVAALIQSSTDPRQRPQTVHAYTYSASGALPNLELAFAQEIADKFGFKHHQLEGSDKLQIQPTSADLHFPEPRFSSRNEDAYAILNHCAEHGGVLLTGFGGDPLLTAEPLRLTDFNSAKKIISLLQQCQHHYRLFGKRPNLGLLQANKKKSVGTNRARSVPAWMNPVFAEKLDLENHIQSVHANKQINHRNGMASQSLWRRIFCWNDPGFTHIPVKLRHPFFDIRLLEYTQSLPPFPWLHDKTILRQSMQTTLPTNVIKRPKTPLPGNGLEAHLQQTGVPEDIFTWLQKPKVENYVNTQLLRQTLTDLDQCQKSDYKAIIRSLTLSYWLEGYEQTTTISVRNRNNDNVTRIKASDKQ